MTISGTSGASGGLILQPGVSPQRWATGAAKVPDLIDRFRGSGLGVVGGFAFGATAGGFAAAGMHAAGRSNRAAALVGIATLGASLIAGTAIGMAYPWAGTGTGVHPRAPVADPNRVATARAAVAGGDANGTHVAMQVREKAIGSLMIDTGDALKPDSRRGHVQVTAVGGMQQVFLKKEDAAAYARATPGDQAVTELSPFEFGANRWAVADVALTSNWQPRDDNPNDGYRTIWNRPEFLTAPGTAAAPTNAISPRDWLGSTPYGIDSIRAADGNAFVEFGGAELVPAYSKYGGDYSLVDASA